MTAIDTDELEDLYEYAPCGYLSLGIGASIERVNATFLAWTGHDRVDLIGQDFRTLLNTSGKIYFETHFAPLLRLQGFFHEVALELVAKDKTRIPVLVNAVEKRDVNDIPISTRITVFNATERRRYESELLAARNALETANQRLSAVNEELHGANQRLDRANRELEAFYETLPVGIFRADQTGQIIQASRRFCTIFNIDTAENWFTGLTRENQDAIASQWDHAIRDGAPFSKRLKVADDDRATRHIELKAVPIDGSDGGKWSFVGVVEDVTEQVRVEAQKRQIDRDAAIRQLTGGLAHNLNGILTVILGNMEMLDDELAYAPNLRPVLQQNLVAAERAAGLVSRLLIYSGQGFARPDLIEIDPCLRTIASDLADQIGHTHQLTFDPNAADERVEIDIEMLKEAIKELIANAVAALPKGGEIRISTKLESGANSEDQLNIVIAVSDRGIGMDQSTLDKASEPFFTGRDVGQGLGLGLSLVDGIARVAEGELRLRSQTGKGTTAELHLPAAR